MSDDNPAVDHVAEELGEKTMEKNLKSRPTWLRLVFMVIFYVLISVAAMVATVVVVLGFLWVLFTGDTNSQLKSTGQSLATYLSQIIRYLTFNTDERPFPFEMKWPSGQSD
jgi:Flp pilus assembly protein TadB